MVEMAMNIYETRRYELSGHIDSGNVRSSLDTLGHRSDPTILEGHVPPAMDTLPGVQQRAARQY